MKPLPYIALALIIAGAGAYYYYQLDTAGEQDNQPVKAESMTIPEDTSPGIQHPVPKSPLMSGHSAEETPAESTIEEPLPPLLESDHAIKEILSRVIGDELVGQFFQQAGIIHQFVITVDSLTGKTVPLKYRLLPPAPAKFMVQKDNSGTITINPDNFTRYDTYIRLLNRLDTGQFVKWYTHFYPLIQEDYDSLGYQNRYFNDRFIFVIDHLLETPKITGPVELVRPGVLYNFADPALEQLSAGQKTLLRIGPANRKFVKAKLTEIREALVSPQESE